MGLRVQRASRPLPRVLAGNWYRHCWRGDVELSSLGELGGLWAGVWGCLWSLAEG